MSTRTLALLATLVAATTPASADGRYTRPQDVKINVTLSDRVKPIAPAPPDKQRQPPITATQALAIEGLLGTVRKEQEDILENLIADTPDADWEEKAKYYFMLGELHAKQQRFWRLKSAELAIDATAQKSKTLAQESEAAGATARTFLLKAVGTYDQLTKNVLFRNYPQMDVALFYYGYTLQSGRYMDEARKVYDKLLKDYPKSKYVPEAHLAFGDYFFEKNQLADAEARYRKVLEFPASSAYWYAKYKTGWIDLNLSRHQEALETFYRVVEGTRRLPKQDVLHGAAKKDFVRAYAEIGRADKALPAFQRVDKAAAFDMLQRLGELYVEQGKSANAIHVYQELMRTLPKHANACLWQYNVALARMSLDGATTSDKVADIEDLVRLYAALSAKKTLPPTEARECRDNATAMAGELARAYHSEAIRTRNAETLGHAERLYRTYLQHFRDAADHAQTQYFYAELLWSRADAEQNARRKTDHWEAAANAFTAVVKAGKVEPKLIKESAYAAVLGWKNRNDIDPRIIKQADRIEDLEQAYAKIPVEKPIPAHDASMIAAFDLYLAHVDPKDEEIVRMKFLKANLYRRYDQLAKAVPLFRDILAKHRMHETAELSAQLLLDTYNRMHRHDDMLALAAELRADKSFVGDKPDLVGTLDRLMIQAMRIRAEEIEKQARASNDMAKFVACGRAYMDIYNHDPEAKQNDEVLYNAIVCFQDGKSIGAVVKAFEPLQAYYKSSKHYARALVRVGKAYGDIAFYDRAVRTLDEYAKKYPGEKDAHGAANDIVFYSKGLGDDAKAIEATQYYVRTFGAKHPKEAANALFSLTTVYEKRGDTDATVQHLRDYLRRFGDSGGADRRVIAHAKIGQLLWQQSCPVKQVDGSCVKITRERAIHRRPQLARRSGERPTQCGAASKIKLTVIPRDARRVKEARAAFGRAIAEFDKVGGTTGAPSLPAPTSRGSGRDDRLARHHYAQAKLVEADLDFEEYLTITFPSGLDFDPARAGVREKSLKRFNTWIAERGTAGGRAKTKYEGVLKLVDNASSITAAARIAQIAQHQADALFSAEIPKDVRTGEFADEKVEAFCDEMSTIADPLEVTAQTAYDECLTQSTKLGWFSEWSQLCERELGQIAPDRYPTASELRARPQQAQRIVAFEPPIKHLE